MRQGCKDSDAGRGGPCCKGTSKGERVGREEEMAGERMDKGEHEEPQVFPSGGSGKASGIIREMAGVTRAAKTMRRRRTQSQGVLRCHDLRCTGADPKPPNRVLISECVPHCCNGTWRPRELESSQPQCRRPVAGPCGQLPSSCSTDGLGRSVAGCQVPVPP